jgi:DNA modification methylase
MTPTERSTKLRVEHVPVSQLRPWPENPRIMPQAEMHKLVRSIETFGLVEPLVVRRSDHLVIGGHQRLDAAKALGLTKVPVVFVDVTEEKAKALNLALNRIQGEWDLPKLGELLDELRELPDFDVTLTGFDGREIDDLLAELERQQPLPAFEESFDAEQAMAEAERSAGPTRVQPGNLWEMGKHRLLCGDATDPASWERLMAGQVAQAVITDPPYGINYVGGRAAQQERISRRRRGGQAAPSDAYWDDLTDDEYRALLISSLGLAHQHSDDKAPLYLWFASSHLRDVLDCMGGTGWEERNLLVWVKNNGAGALFAQYKHWYEPCFYAFKKGKAPRWHGPTNERTVWEHDKPVVNDLHPTMKPVALIERAIINSTCKKQLVVDSFLGSGTAVIAAQRTGRICYGMERDARYCDVILARWEALTGQEAGCLPSGSPPSAGAASRKAAPSSTKPTPVRGRKRQ